jgi:serine/threonine-protein phosphatase 2A regulatory subunit A
LLVVANLLLKHGKELLPFISDGIDDEDDVLLAVAMSLGKMVEYVGGPEYARLLLHPLELLLTIEEISVRDAASDSALYISERMSDESFQSDYADMVARLAMKEWFTARTSAARLISTAYPRLKINPKKQQEHLLLFSRLCRDETPMVRRIAAQYLGKMLRNVVESLGRDTLSQTGIVVQVLMPLFEEFASNDQPDAVRLRTTENCVVFGEVMSDLSKKGPLTNDELDLLRRILPLIVATIDDRSWRVRWTAAAKYADVISAYDQLPEAMDSLVPAYEKLLQDPEAEVRTAATFNLAHVAKCKAKVPSLPSQQNRTPQDSVDSLDVSSGPRVSVAERLVKRVTSLTEDDSEHVRAALAMVATELAPVLGKDATITYLVPPVLLLLRDAASEVRLNLISSLAALNEVIGVDLLSQSLLPAILDLAQDGKWRIRLAIIQHIPLLAKQLGKEFFTEKLSSLCVGWLGDDIASIRRAAATNLKVNQMLFGLRLH